MNGKLNDDPSNPNRPSVRPNPRGVVATGLLSSAALIGLVAGPASPAQAGPAVSARHSTALPPGSTLVPDPPRGWRGIRLGTLGGAFSEVAEGKHALNARGQVVGRSTTADGRSHAFLWDPRTGMRDLTPGASFATARSVNDRGEVVGILQEGGEWKSFIWDARRGLRIPDGLPGPQDINNRGEVVGGADHLWSPRHGRISFGAPQDAEVTASDVNETSQVTGVYSSPATGGRWRAFFWSRSTGWRDLYPAGALYTTSFDLNASGTVFGTVNRDAQEIPFVRDRRHGLVTLHFGPGNFNSAEGINDRGDTVVWNGRVRDRWGRITQIAVDGATVHAEAINNRGTVAGQLSGSGLPSSTLHAFVRTRGRVIDLGPATGPVQNSYDTVFLNAHDQVAFTSGDQAVLWSPR